MGAEAILRLTQLFHKIGIQLHLTHIKGKFICQSRFILKEIKLTVYVFYKKLKGKIFTDLKRFSFGDKFDYKFIYPSNHDAVCFLTKHEPSSSSNTQIISLRVSSTNEIS